LAAKTQPGWAGGRFQIKGTMADVGVVAQGPTVESALASAVAGMYWIISPSTNVRSTREVTVEEEGHDAPLAFARALQRLLVHFDAEAFLGAEGSVAMEWAAPSRCRIKVRGEAFDPAHHASGVEVKAVTHHELVVDRRKRRVEVLFDICLRPGLARSRL
jgi:SHS2 domain-containing protein